MARFRAIHPVLPVRSVQDAIQYYTALLGFKLTFQDSAEDTRYACIQRDSIELHLQWHEPADFREGVDTGAFRFLIDDVDGLYEEYRGKGVFHSGTELRDTPWGTREFAFYDPDGNGLFFYQPLK